MTDFMPYLVVLTALLVAIHFIITNIRLDAIEKKLREQDDPTKGFVGDKIVPLRRKE